jgi:hypothetical protein
VRGVKNLSLLLLVTLFLPIRGYELDPSSIHRPARRVATQPLACFTLSRYCEIDFCPTSLRRFLELMQEKPPVQREKVSASVILASIQQEEVR